MKIVINENQLKLIKETIDPIIATNDVEAVKTVCDGRRGVSFVSSLTPEEYDIIVGMVDEYNLDSIKVPSNKHNAYIIFDPKFKKQALRLLDIAEKYNGYLYYKATDDETREIGQLLGYNEDSINHFILKKQENERSEKKK
jgi:hypothetical protein